MNPHAHDAALTESEAHAQPDHAGHTGHAGHADHAAVFRNRFWLSLVLAVPTVALSEMFGYLLGYQVPESLLWVAPALGTVIFVYGGWPFLSGAVSELRARQPGMMLLVALAITVAFVASGLTSLGLFRLELDFWWELALLVVIMLLGHWVEMRALGRTSSALEALAAMLPDEAERVTDGGVESVTLDQLRADDVVLVRSGGRVPADGEIVEGAATFDESMITGESRPVERERGERVVAVTVATDNAVRVRVRAIGEDTALAGIRRLVEQAQTARSRAQALADRAAGWLFYFATGVGVITFVVWTLIGTADQAIERTITVLVIACPHALGLAIPLVIAIATGVSARNGVLVKDRLSLERMRTVDVVLFDKTGTLTRGTPTMTDRAGAAGHTGEQALVLAAAVESDSEHPLARAIVTAGQELGDVPAATDFRSMTGRGVHARVDGADVAVGGPAMLRESGLDLPADLARSTDEWASRGATVLYVVRSGQVIGALALEDEIRPESKAAVDALHARGVRVGMITGDARPVAEAVGERLGIDRDAVFAEVLPEHKESTVAGLQAEGRRVAMVGDGVNDAPALARADVGVAIGAGTDVAIESAGVVLASDDPRMIVGVADLSRASYRKMWQNLGWAAGYNLLAVPLAAGVLAPIGFVLPMEVGAILMSASTVIVALNAALLRRIRLRPDEVAA